MHLSGGSIREFIPRIRSKVRFAMHPKWSTPEVREGSRGKLVEAALELNPGEAPGEGAGLSA
jgi:hypothetical protein